MVTKRIAFLKDVVEAMAYLDEEQLVTSVFDRVGDVVAEEGDYSYELISGGHGNDDHTVDFATLAYVESIDGDLDDVMADLDSLITDFNSHTDDFNSHTDDFDNHTDDFDSHTTDFDNHTSEDQIHRPTVYSNDESEDPPTDGMVVYYDES